MKKRALGGSGVGNDVLIISLDGSRQGRKNGAVGSRWLLNPSPARTRDIRLYPGRRAV